jgi:hypothetical protein
MALESKRASLRIAPGWEGAGLRAGALMASAALRAWAAAASDRGGAEEIV